MVSHWVWRRRRRMALPVIWIVVSRSSRAVSGWRVVTSAAGRSKAASSVSWSLVGSSTRQIRTRMWLIGYSLVRAVARWYHMEGRPVVVLLMFGTELVPGLIRAYPAVAHRRPGSRAAADRGGRCGTAPDDWALSGL